MFEPSVCFIDSNNNNNNKDKNLKSNKISKNSENCKNKHDTAKRPRKEANDIKNDNKGNRKALWFH